MSKRIYVGNLPYSATEPDLAAIFEQIGQVQSVKLITDRETGRSKGYGFVEMADEADVATAISRFHGAEFQGRALTVSEAQGGKPESSGLRRR